MKNLVKPFLLCSLVLIVGSGADLDLAEVVVLRVMELQGSTEEILVTTRTSSSCCALT